MLSHLFSPLQGCAFHTKFTYEFYHISLKIGTDLIYLSPVFILHFVQVDGFFPIRVTPLKPQSGKMCVRMCSYHWKDRETSYPTGSREKTSERGWLIEKRVNFHRFTHSLIPFRCTCRPLRFRYTSPIVPGWHQKAGLQCIAFRHARNRSTPESAAP